MPLLRLTKNNNFVLIGQKIRGNLDFQFGKRFLKICILQFYNFGTFGSGSNGIQPRIALDTPAVSKLAFGLKRGPARLPSNQTRAPWDT